MSDAGSKSLLELRGVRAAAEFPYDSGLVAEKFSLNAGGLAVVEIARETSYSPPPGSRITSYGYPDDETPDTNSANGIGSHTTEADAKGARDAPTRLRPGDIAVSPDVERELTAAGVKPREEITVQLADGSTHRGRWMDRTRSDLTGRIDLYSPDAKDTRSGARVVGWSL